MNEERAQQVHRLKTWPEYFSQVESGQKTFEVRKNDRDFQNGDIVTLMEFDPNESHFTGKVLSFKIGYILNLTKYLGVEGDFVVFSLLPILDVGGG